MEVIFLFLFCNCQRCLRGKSCIRSLAGCYLSYCLKHQSAAASQHIKIDLALQCKAAEGHIQFLFCFFTSNFKCFCNILCHLILLPKRPRALSFMINILHFWITLLCTYLIHFTSLHYHTFAHFYSLLTELMFRDLHIHWRH